MCEDDYCIYSRITVRDVHIYIYMYINIESCKSGPVLAHDTSCTHTKTTNMEEGEESS